MTQFSESYSSGISVFNVITIEREYGAGGSLVAAQLANRLGWELLDQKITQYIAQLAAVDKSVVARCDERCDPLMHRLAKVFWRGSYERMLPVDDTRFFDTDSMVRLASKIIEDAGAKGKCVIVGRGAPYILRDRPDRFAVFCYASRESKIERLTSLKVPRAEAENLVEVIDAERATFIKRYFGKDWPHRPLYNLMVNTELGIEPAVEMILSAMKITADQQVLAH
jgi:cytidylate kinase